MTDINTNIQSNLTPDEQEVFGVIREVVKAYAPSTKVYAVGGWTRDKLLGIPSDDLDIMTSNMSGEDFAKLVTKHMGIKDPNIIRANPEKSKHITTATATIPLSSGTELKVDFAQARSESYTDDSRIPDIQPATPQEDAHRRDLTINSLFYDIGSNEVIDFTGNGIKDLIAMNIQTPEEPVKTFRDDPLRIFRAIRFAAKYGGTIDPDTYAAMSDPSLREVINRKVSKERVGVEVVKMLGNKNAEVALGLLHDTGLFQDIINESLKGTQYEDKMAPIDMDQNNPWHKLNLWDHTMQVVKNVLDIYPDGDDTVDPEKRVTMILSALMHDMGKLYTEIQDESKTHPGNTSYHGHEKESIEISEHILRYLKIEPYIQQVSGLAGAHMKPHKFTDEATSKTLRKFIRQMGEKSLNWVDVLNFSIADALSKDATFDQSIVDKYRALEVQLQEAMASMGPISDKNVIKPVIDGNRIMQILNIKPGPWMKDVTEFIKDLMDENPNVTQEEAEAAVVQQFGNTEMGQPMNDKQAKSVTAGDEEKKPSSTCPNHLLKQKLSEISDAKSNEQYYELYTILKELDDGYRNDEKVTRIVANYMFFLITKDKKFRDNNLLQHIFSRAQSDFFDPSLCCATMGILLMEDTATEDNVIMEIAERMTNMAPGIVRSILEMLPPDEEVFRPELKRKIYEMLK